MNEVQYIDDELTRSVKPITIDYEITPQTFKPLRINHSDIFRPVIPQPISREQSFTIRKPQSLPKLDLPIEKIPFCCFDEYLLYKQLYDS